MCSFQDELYQYVPSNSSFNVQASFKIDPMKVNMTYVDQRNRIMVTNAHKI